MNRTNHWLISSTSFRAWRMCVPSIGATLEVKVLPRADCRERKEVQLCGEEARNEPVSRLTRRE
ncbi:hypothetical protein FJC84_23020 [Escherichia coli]|nr:hypothetical protein [Escherichia coli]